MRGELDPLHLNEGGGAEQRASGLSGTLSLGMALCSYDNSLFETCQIWPSVPGLRSSQ